VGINCCYSIYPGGKGSDPKGAGSGHLRPCESIRGSVPGQENIVAEGFSEVSRAWLWR